MTDPKKSTKWLQICPYPIIPSSYIVLYTLNVLLVADLSEVLGHLIQSNFLEQQKVLDQEAERLGLGTMPHLQLGLGFRVAEEPQTKVDKMVELMLAIFS